MIRWSATYIHQDTDSCLFVRPSLWPSVCLCICPSVPSLHCFLPYFRWTTTSVPPMTVWYTWPWHTMPPWSGDWTQPMGWLWHRLYGTPPSKVDWLIVPWPMHRIFKTFNFWWPQAIAWTSIDSRLLTSISLQFHRKCATYAVKLSFESKAGSV